LGQKQGENPWHADCIVYLARKAEGKMQIIVDREALCGESTLDQSLWYAIPGREILCVIDSADYRRRAVVYQLRHGTQKQKEQIHMLILQCSVMLSDSAVKGGLYRAIKQGTKFVQAPEWTADDTRALFS